MRALPRAGTGAVLAVLLAAGTTGCTGRSIGGLLRDHERSHTARTLGTSPQLTSPTIATPRRDPLGLDLCTVLTPEEIAATLHPPTPPRHLFGGCAWTSPQHESLRISIAGMRGEHAERTQVRGNSALQQRSPGGCEVTVALNGPRPHTGMVPELSLTQIVRDEHAEVCPTVRELATRAVDRLPTP